MITLIYSKKYLVERKKFLKHNLLRANNLTACLKFFVNNPTHPSLHTEKLGGTNIWTIRIDTGNRLFFIWMGDKKAALIGVGPHDKYRKY